jgi:radical SAM protein with 4Fe4S-binding SPASM domain
MNKEFAFQWHITDFCNLRCKHCYQDRFDKERDLSFEVLEKIIFNIIKTLKEHNYSFLIINITGGEPLISENLFPILNILEREKFVKEFYIITNGIFLNKFLDKLSLYKKLKYLKISLEGGKEETNDMIRGLGNFKRIIEILMNISLEKVLMFTLAKYNYKEIPEMINLTDRINGKGLILERFIPLGRGKNLFDKTLNANEWYDVCKIISDIYNINPKDLLPYKAFYLDLEKDELYGALCNIGDESMCLMPNGIVYPCRRLPIQIGDLKLEDFSDIISRLRSFKMKILKERLKGKCSSCDIKECTGCRALTYNLKGDLLGEDPQCFYLKF